MRCTTRGAVSGTATVPVTSAASEAGSTVRPWPAAASVSRVRRSVPGTVTLTAGSLAESVLGADRTVERYLCGYGPAGHLDTLRAHGLRFTGTDEEGQVRIAELGTDRHPFFLATLFRPELHGDGSRPHPIVQAPARAAVEHARAATSV